MLIEDLISNTNGLGSRVLHSITTNCSQFITESAGLPLFKNLSTTYSNFQRVKVRRQKRKDTVAEAYDKAFADQYSNIRQRAIFAYSSEYEPHGDTEPFYVFPVNGFSYLYSKEVTNSSSDYKRVIDTLIEQFDDAGQATDIVIDLLKYTYSNVNLSEGINASAEIIMYGISHYYAVRVSAIPNYSKLVTIIK